MNLCIVCPEAIVDVKVTAGSCLLFHLARCNEFIGSIWSERSC